MHEFDIVADQMVSTTFVAYAICKILRFKLNGTEKAGFCAGFYYRWGVLWDQAF